jgi:hypothetical protein
MAQVYPKIIFEPQKIGEGDWQIRAHCPGAELQYIKGFKTEADARKWPGSDECGIWLKARGWA